MRRQKHPHVGEGTRCGLFGKTRDARCAHQRRATARALPAGLVLPRVAGVCRELPHGPRQLHFLLLLRGPCGAGRDYPMALLAGHGRLIRRRKRRVVTARAWLPLLRRPSLIGRLTASRAEQVWVSDSTYVRLRSGWSYRRPIRDPYSHKIVGVWPHADWSVRGTLTARHPGPGRPYPAAAVGSSLGPGLAVRRPRRGLAGKPRRGPGYDPARRSVRKRGGRAGQRYPAGCM